MVTWQHLNSGAPQKHNPKDKKTYCWREPRDCEELIPIERIVDFDFKLNPFEQISRAAVAAPFILLFTSLQHLDYM